MQIVAADSQIGPLLRHWRATRRMSQLDLALEANVSTRHVSFVETGRSQPSRQMVLAFAEALAIPTRERNALLLAAGYAPLYRETGLDAPAMATARQALTLILRQQDPFPTLALDRLWQIVMVNGAWSRLLALSQIADLPPYTVLPQPQPNLLRLLFDPALRALVANWEAVAQVVLRRAQHEAANDPERAALLAEITALPDIPADWQRAAPELPTSPGLLVPFIFQLGEQSLQLLSTITTLGTAQDITLQELHIESFYPTDQATETFLRRLAAEREQ